MTSFFDHLDHFFLKNNFHNGCPDNSISILQKIYLFICDIISLKMKTNRLGQPSLVNGKIIIIPFEVPHQSPSCWGRHVVIKLSWRLTKGSSPPTTGSKLYDFEISYSILTKFLRKSRPKHCQFSVRVTYVEFFILTRLLSFCESVYLKIKVGQLRH